jgi:hypothetical protein
LDLGILGSNYYRAYGQWTWPKRGNAALCHCFLFKLVQ